VSSGLAPEAALSVALSVAHGGVPDLVHALLADLVPSPVHGAGREVEKEVGPSSLAPPVVQRVWWVEEV